MLCLPLPLVSGGEPARMINNIHKPVKSIKIMKYIKPSMEEVRLNLCDGIMAITSIQVKEDEEITDPGKILAPERRGRRDAWQQW